MFFSAQGEGLHVGVPSVFVRFGECDLRCAWCDSPGTWSKAASCRIEQAPGSEKFCEIANPVDLEKLREPLAALLGPPGSFVSLTGGEPLLQPEAVAELARFVRGTGRRAYLETHGLATRALEDVVDQVDVISMDWKLASDVRRHGEARRAEREPFTREHEAFLAVARRAPELFVKVVVTPNTLDDELREMCAAIARQSREIPLVLQPVTPFGTLRETPSPEQLLAWLRECGSLLADVRLVPQTHRAYGAL